MVESPSETNGLGYGHVSYVYEVTRDASGKVVGYKIAEGNWDDKLHYEEFSWEDTRQVYVSSSGKRSPDLFVY